MSSARPQKGTLVSNEEAIMRELKEHDFSRVLSLYSKADIDFPLIRAVIENKQTGRIWVDRNDEPSNAIVCTKFGFTYLFGGGNNEKFDSEIEKLVFEDSSFRIKYLLWYSPSKAWQKKMDLMPDDIAKKRKRIQLKFNREKFNRFVSQKSVLPKGVFLRRLNVRLIEKTSAFNLDLENRFWNSANDLVRNGFGFCVLQNDEIASLCYSACVVNGISEIDVATLHKYRRLGLATIAASAFIKYSIENDIIPNWDSFDYNEASLKLARRLGFEERVKYPFYSVNRATRFSCL